MRMKSEHTSIKNLNPIFTEPLQKFDRLHIGLMGTQAVVTSVNTGRHWGSIKKENRPVGWENFTEAQVREFSNSKHYTDEALDFRRRNPIPPNGLIYYDDLTETEQRYFMAEIYKCFPDEFFDITFSRLCIHVEHDPDFDVRKPRGLVSEDLKPRIKDRPGAMISDEVEPIKVNQRKIVVTELDKMWLYLDRSAVIMGSINFITKRLTGMAWFKDKLKIGKDQSLIQRLIELINVIINKLKGPKQ